MQPGKMNTMKMIKVNAMSAVLLFGVISLQSQAAPIDLGVAGQYSGFFFGDVNAASDVEGRLAVGGNLNAGFDIGYRNEYNSDLLSLVVAGDIKNFNYGTIYNGPSYMVDTNSGIGPSMTPWLPGGVNYGTVKYGGSLDVHQWTMAQFQYSPDYINFNDVLNHLTLLSGSLYGLSQSGTVEQKDGGLMLTGDGLSDVHVFNLGTSGDLTNLSFSNIKEGAHIVINSSASQVTLGGFQGGDKANSNDTQAKYRDRLLFNFGHAEQLNINTFVNGSILAYGADVFGSGHTEGTLIGHSLSVGQWGGKLELGYEPFLPYLPDTPVPVPAPASLLMLLSGLLLLARSKQ